MSARERVRYMREMCIRDSFEAEAGHVGAAGDLRVAHDHEVVAAGDDLPQLRVRVDALAVLVYVADHHGLADVERAAVDRLKPHDHLEQGGLEMCIRDSDVDSLNVAAASAVAFWELRTKWR